MAVENLTPNERAILLAARRECQRRIGEHRQQVDRLATLIDALDVILQEPEPGGSNAQESDK